MDFPGNPEIWKFIALKWYRIPGSRRETLVTRCQYWHGSWKVRFTYSVELFTLSPPKKHRQMEFLYVINYLFSYILDYHVWLSNKYYK